MREQSAFLEITEAAEVGEITAGALAYESRLKDSFFLLDDFRGALELEVTEC
jgi:hypothetical protein